MIPPPPTLAWSVDALNQLHKTERTHFTRVLNVYDAFVHAVSKTLLGRVKRRQTVLSINADIQRAIMKI